MILYLRGYSAAEAARLGQRSARGPGRLPAILSLPWGLLGGMALLAWGIVAAAFWVAIWGVGMLQGA